MVLCVFTTGEAAAKFFASEAFAVDLLESVATSGSVSDLTDDPFPHLCGVAHHSTLGRMYGAWDLRYPTKSVFCLCAYLQVRLCCLMQP